VAQSELLNLIKAGGEEWNRWRHDSGSVADLIEADLSGFDLTNFNFSSAFLNDANLSGANLTYADLRGASFAGRRPLPMSGNVLISVKDQDKEKILEPARTLIGLGFQIIATGGTERYLNKNSIPASRANKVLEGRPHAEDFIINGEISLFLNTTEGKQATADSHSLRFAACDNGVPLFLNMDAIVNAVDEIKREIESQNLNEEPDQRKPRRDSRRSVKIIGTDLSGANLRYADCEGAIFRHAVLNSADLSLCTNLTQEQVDSAHGDDRTRLPAHLIRPAHWPQHRGSESSEKNLSNEDDAEVKLRTSPPYRFEWQTDGPQPRLTPAPPPKRQIYQKKVNKTVRDHQLETVARLSLDLLQGFANYQKSRVDDNRASFVRDVSDILQKVAHESSKSGDLVLASYLRAKVSILIRLAQTDFEALEGVDQAELKTLFNECVKLWDFFPELIEIDDPSRIGEIPDSISHEGDRLADSIIDLVNSEDGKELFSQDVEDVLKTEREFVPPRFLNLVANPEDRINIQKEKLVRFGGIIGAIRKAFDDAPPSVHTLGSFSSIFSAVKELWHFVKTFL
tara:strand:+ start:611 stop:2317 length:1707 start_codon:yes stop_codon:yes gene_type:complete